MPFLRPLSLRLLAVAFATFTLNSFAANSDSPRERLLLDFNWKFHLGDDWPNMLRLDKAGQNSGPASERFSDVSWRTVNLPHDWAIELPFDKSSDTSHGFKPVGPGFAKNSVGWYRRTFDLPAGDAGKRLWLEFDGAFRDTRVFVNGWEMKHNESGYFPFRCDITDVARIGGKNTIAVRVDATKFEGWFYEGAGIYRHVWLEKTAPVAIAPDGIFVWSKLTNGAAAIVVQTKILNSEFNDCIVVIHHNLFDSQGNLISKITSMPDTNDPPARLNLHLHSQLEDEMGFILGIPTGENPATWVAADHYFYFAPNGMMPCTNTPELWSPENPKLYKLITTVSVEGKVVDQKETAFGIRTVAFDKDKGFLLNGQPYELKGTCNHQDMAGVGAALPDALQDFRIAKLKEFGDNALRTSHNPPTPELLDACDRLGMIVMDENRLLGSDDANMARFEDLIRRDRNHPSVCIWSICNEESTQTQPVSARVGLTMQNTLLQLDPTRPVTAAESVGDVATGLTTALQVRGWNYHVGKSAGQYGKEVDSYHGKHPEQPNVGTEQGSTVSTRGIYENDKTRGYVSAYDVNAPSWANTAEEWYSIFAARPWLSGGFVWTGFDYRGEPTPYAWPCINSHFGILDTCGFWKDIAWYYQSWWTTNTVLHLLPHWNWAGKEGQEIRVDAFSNCKQVELFLNGASLGKQEMKINSHLSWQVKYAPGTLSAKGFDANGNQIAETKVETTGDAAAVQLTPNRTTINADGEDVSVFTVSVTDAQSRVVPVAGNSISFKLDGPGKILGVGNGDPSCHEPDTFIPQLAFRSVPENTGWRWRKVPNVNSQRLAEYRMNFDDSTWDGFDPQAYTGQLSDQENAIYRSKINVTAEDLAAFAIELCIGSLDDNGFVYVNGQRVGESHDWQSPAVFDVKPFLHAGENVVAVGVSNWDGPGGLTKGVTLQFADKPGAPEWKRSAFNGLAQVIVQSTKDTGEIKLTASAEGLQSATASITTRTTAGRPSVP